MYEDILRHLLQQERVTPDEAEAIRQFESKKPFSLHWELKTLMYSGVLLLNAGLGYLIYEHIHTIGHAAIIALIGAISVGCFWYAFTHGRPFSRESVESPTPYFDYILLLGCFTFLLMEGYWQYQYQVFGTRYGLATFIPMLLFFVLAYRFDHRGVLSLGITALGSWLGVTVTLQDLLAKNDFNSETLVQTGIFLGWLLIAVPFVSERRGLKPHFSPTYLHFAVHVLMISCLAGAISLHRPAIYFPLLCLAASFFFWYARAKRSFFFLTAALVYAYIGLTYVLFSSAPNLDFMAYLLYFVLSCVGIIVFLTNYKRFIS